MKYPTRSKVLPGPTGGTFVIFFHGLFSGSLDPLTGANIHTLSQRLAGANVASVGLYETSRNLLRDNREFMVWAKESFAGKTFEMEKQDVALALKELIHACPSYKRLVFVGFSLGGTLSTYFLDTYKPTAVLMFGSGCTTRSKNVPIGSSYPAKQEILDNLKNFTGTLKIIQGTKDTVVPKAGAMQIVRAASKAMRRDFIQLLGVDHRFLLRDGKADPAITDILYKEIIDTIKAV